MFARTILLGAALGVAGYYLYEHPEARARLRSRGRTLGGQIREQTTALREWAAVPKSHERLAHMIDKESHREDIPETEMKQAFKEAVGDERPL